MAKGVSLVLKQRILDKKLRPTDLSEMYRFTEMLEQPIFAGFWVDDITTRKLIRYGKNNRYTYVE